MKTLYFDCFAGASGDMILGALIALGLNEKDFLQKLSKLGVSDYKISFEIVDRSGISSIKANVIVPVENEHRHLRDIEKIIDDSALADTVKTRAKLIFENLAKAEASVHGIEPEKVHFHEVGAMDAIIDIVGACIGFEMLQIERFICSKIHVGSGFVQMQHGKFPVPPPAVAELLSKKNVPIYSTEIQGELLTPTGAAIITTVCEDFGPIAAMEIDRVGYGAGSRQHDNFPNVLRLVLGKTDNFKTKTDLETEKLLVLETNIDDLSPEILGYVMERAFELGALDFWFIPIQMKKNRPAIMLSLLCNPSDKDKFLRFIFSETTTLGVRVKEVDRNCLSRTASKISTDLGEITLKTGKLDGKIVNVKPEYEELRRIAIESGRPLREIRDEILKKIENE